MKEPAAKRARLGLRWAAATAGALVLGSASLGVWLAAGAPSEQDPGGSAAEGTPVAAIPTSRFPVTVRPAASSPRVLTGRTNYRGEAVTVGCSTCHTTTQPNIETHSSVELDQFHQGLKYSHGNQACLSCHNAQNYDTLHLATGKPVEFADVMTLCAQCHGTAMRDYLRGLHGGMNGHWDLAQGPRTRNNCVNCHDPHAPKYPQAMPVFPPRDRISVPKKLSQPVKHP